MVALRSLDDEERADLTVELERLQVARHRLSGHPRRVSDDQLWDLDMRIRDLRRTLNGLMNGAERTDLDGRALRAKGGRS